MASRLFVGNLPYSCTEEDIRRIFHPRWAVTDVRIVTDRDTGQPRGFAFVELESDGAAREALDSLDGCQLGGRRVAIREAHERQGAKPRREEREVKVDTVTRRSGTFRGGARSGGRVTTQRWEPPPDPVGLDPFGDDRGEQRSAKKRDRHDGDDW